MDTAFETLSHHYTSIHQDMLPKEIEESRKNLHFISKILYYISVKNYQGTNITAIQQKWPKWKSSVLRLVQDLKISFQW